MNDKELREELRDIIIDYTVKIGKCANDLVDTILSKYCVIKKANAEVVNKTKDCQFTDRRGIACLVRCKLGGNCLYKDCKIKSIIIVKENQ